MIQPRHRVVGRHDHERTFLDGPGARLHPAGDLMRVAAHVADNGHPKLVVDAEEGFPRLPDESSLLPGVGFCARQPACQGDAGAAAQQGAAGKEPAPGFAPAA